MRSSLPPFPPIDCSFCPKKRRGPSRFICRFNNRGSLCATLFEWLIRCLQPSGPTHNAARGNFATPSTFHSPLATLLLQHRLPSFYTLQSSFPVHPCVPRFVDVANFSPSLNPILPLLPCRLLSIFSRRPRHHLSLGRIPFLRYPSRRFLPSKILDSNLSEIRFFHFFTSMIGEIWIESEGAIIRECKRLCTCVREKEKNQKVIPFFFFFPLSLLTRRDGVERL